MLFRSRLYTIGLILFSWILSIFLITSVLESVHIPLSTGYIIIFNVLFFGSWYYAGQKAQSSKTTIGDVICSIIVIIGSLFIANHFYDYSYDGQGYHGEAIMGIRNGWNPFYGTISPGNSNYIFVKCFAKASWVVGGFIYKMTGHFQSAKGSNLVLIFANLFVAVPFFAHWIKSKFLVWVLALFVAFNPVTLNMYLSNMLDTHVANTTMIFFLLTVIYLRGQRSTFLLLLLGAAIIYLINLKFTPGVYCFIYCAGIGAYLLFTRQLMQQKQLVIVLGLALVLGVAYWGYPTYVRNTVEHHHPFFPLEGPNHLGGVFAMDYMSGNPVVNITKSIFAKTTFDRATSHHIQYKIPFTISRYELERFGFAGVMVGGFGVWFSGICLLSLVLMGFTFYKYGKTMSKEVRTGIIVLWVTVLCSVFVNPHGYIARYVPQLWVIPISIYVFYYYHSKKNNWLSYLLMIVICINLLLINGYTYLNFWVTKERNKELAAMQGKAYKVKTIDETAARIMLDEHHIQYKWVQTLDTTKKIDKLTQSELYYQEQ